MKTAAIRLPKQIENDERCDAVSEVLGKTQKLWSGAKNQVAFIPFSMGLIRAMQMEHKKGRLIRGYELIERTLVTQANGQQQVDEKTGASRGKRISRLLIISNDGSDRYLRKVDALISQHGQIVLPVIIDADSERLGQLFFGEGKAVKLLLVEHKESVAAVLLAMVSREEPKED